MDPRLSLKAQDGNLGGCISMLTSLVNAVSLLEDADARKLQVGTVATKAFDVAGTITLKCNQDDAGIAFDRFSWTAAMMKRDDSAQRDATWQASYAQVQQVRGVLGRVALGSRILSRSSPRL